MQSLSTSIVSLHSRTESQLKAKNPKKTSGNVKPSIVYFLVLFYSLLCMGLGAGLAGPTLLKFSEQIQQPLDRTVFILFARSFGFLIGTLVGGVLIDRFSSFGQSFLAFSILFMCAATMIMPLIYELVLMICAHLVWSFTAGVVDNLGQILTIRHYEKHNVNPYLQALHSAFGIGAFISPLVMAPFLRKDAPVDQWHYAYWLIGGLHLPNLIWISVYAIQNELLAKKPKEINLESKEFVPEEKEKEAASETDKKGIPSGNLSLLSMFILALITLFIALYVGSESAFGAYIHTYAILHLNFEKDIAAYLNSAFWAAFAVGRICGIPLSLKLTPLQMITSDLIGSIISLVMIFIWNRSAMILWIGSIFLGFTSASIYASAIAYTEMHISITGKRMSILAVGGSAGDAVIPLMIGYSINSPYTGPLGFVIISGGAIVFSAALFGFIVLCVRHQSKAQAPSDK